MKNTFDIRGKTVVIEVLSACGKREVLIDLADLPAVASIPGTWSIFCPGSKVWYAKTSIPTAPGKRKIVLLHRWLMNSLPGFEIDHRNHNGLDNRRNNLRITTHQGNAWHQNGLRKDNTTGFRGVTIDKRDGRYCARLGRKSLGYYDTAEAASAAFDAAFKSVVRIKP